MKDPAMTPQDYIVTKYPQWYLSISVPKSRYEDAKDWLLREKVYLACLEQLSKGVDHYWDAILLEDKSKNKEYLFSFSKQQDAVLFKLRWGEP